MKRAPQIGVIGASQGNLPKDVSIRGEMLISAERLGTLIAQNGAILITGGTDGIMEAVSKGAFEAGGITVGTPGRERDQCNQYVTVEICTPIDVGDYLFAGILSSDIIIVYPGGPGTIAEYALAYRFKKPMIVMGGFDPAFDALIGKKLDDLSSRQAFMGASSPETAMELAQEFLRRKE